MKAAKFISVLIVFIILTSCGSNDNKSVRNAKSQNAESVSLNVPVDKGFSEYISGYTSGIVPANSTIEIRLTPEFAAKTNKSASGLFDFEPSVKGKTEWKDETTLVFTPSRLLNSETTYNIGFNLGKLSDVKEKLRVFPLKVQTVKKDFRVTFGALDCSVTEGNGYILHGQIIASDYIEPSEAENYLTAKLGRNKLALTWDHSANLIHKFTITGISRTDKNQELNIDWDGSSYGANQKGSSSVNIPAAGDFSVLDVLTGTDDNQKIEIVFSDAINVAQETEGLIHFNPLAENTVSITSNIVTVLPSKRLQGIVVLNVESSIKNTKGANLSASFSKQLDFTSFYPAIQPVGKGVILPSSKNLIFPFRAVNLKSVDLRIIKIFENNLPYFLQENEINSGNSIKRFGRPVYSGKVDLVTGSAMNDGLWNLYTIDLADYINVEPGILYKVELGMRRSYSLYPCGATGEVSKYEEALN